VNPSQEGRSEEQGEIGTISQVLNPGEVVVDRIEDLGPAQVPMEDMVLIRMNTTLDDFTWGSPDNTVRLESGHRYRVPISIAAYLDGLGYVWH
jgi:hypothetical protein